jgi:hypothetical protein
MKTIAEPVDAILEEIHETRRRLLQQHGGIHGLASFLRAQEAKGDREIRTPDATSEPEQVKHRNRGPVG